MGLPDPHPFNLADLNKHSNLQIDSRTLLLGGVFVLLVLISTISLVCFLYMCIRRTQSSAANINDQVVRPSTLQSPSSPVVAPSTGLDNATINCMPIVLYGSTSFSGGDTCRAVVGEDCSICLAVFQVGDKVKVLPPCYHGFHSECVDEWLSSRPSCPLCRACIVRVHSLPHSDLP